MPWWQILLMVVGGYFALIVILATIKAVFSAPTKTRDLDRARRRAERLHDPREFRDLSLQRYYLRHPELVSRAARAATPRLAKRDVFLGQGPRTFYFLDEQAVHELHSQVVKEAEPVEVETKQKESKAGGIVAQIPFVGSALQRAKETSVKRRYVKEENLGDMYNRVETSLLENDQVTLEIEDFVKHEPSIEEFRDMCEQMDKRFNTPISKVIQEQYIQQQREAIAVEKLNQLRAAGGYLLMRGAFVVTQTDDTCMLEYVHPLNENFVSQEKSATIRCSLSKQQATPSGSSTFLTSPKINITLLGKVVCWDEGEWTLRLNPLAIY